MECNEITEIDKDTDNSLESNIQFEDVRLIPREDPPTLSMLEVYVSEVHPQDCSILINILNNKVHDKTISHLKRIRKTNNQLQVICQFK